MGLPQCMAQSGGLLRLQTYLLQGFFLFWVPSKPAGFCIIQSVTQRSISQAPPKKKKMCLKPKEAYQALCFYLSESESVSHSVVSNSLRPHGLQPTRFLCPWNSAGKNTGVGCHSLHQGIFPSRGSNPGLLHCRQILYCLSHQGSCSILVVGIAKYNTHLLLWKACHHMLQATGPLKTNQGNRLLKLGWFSESILQRNLGDIILEQICI